ncbi:HPP family-domain-containing protein [Chiua virens]|nr:HPP family-domain-containing protein [Chiua virens]
MELSLLRKTAPYLSHWLGHRSSPPKPLPTYAVFFWSFIAAFCGVSVIQVPFRAHYFVQREVPSVIASYGASAVLIYGAIDSPLAQPRALIGGHFIGALIGVCISKLFQLLPLERYLEVQWLAGSLSVALALVAMQLTKTVHPPAGATALLAAVNQEVIDISWYLLPVVLLSSTLGLAVALLVNNIQRRYPAFWITPTVGPGPLPVAPEPLKGHADDKPLTQPTDV